MAANIYTTTQGDAWDSIVYRLWGEERHMNRLIAANPDHADTLIFPAGVELCVPEQPASHSKTKELPPWMQ